MIETAGDTNGLGPSHSSPISSSMAGADRGPSLVFQVHLDMLGHRGIPQRDRQELRLSRQDPAYADLQAHMTAWAQSSIQEGWG